MIEANEIHRVELSRAEDDHLRIELVIGSFPNAVSESLGHDDEGVQISVLVDCPANPLLLDIELAALERAQALIAEQVATLREAIKK